MASFVEMFVSTSYMVTLFISSSLSVLGSIGVALEVLLERTNLGLRIRWAAVYLPTHPYSIKLPSSFHALKVGKIAVP